MFLLISQTKNSVIVSVDATINQAITNILKNAGKAIESRMLKEKSAEEPGIINVFHKKILKVSY